MKLTVIGFGQCGGRIADQFTDLNSRARRERHFDIAPAVFAVNTDTADLSGLKYIPNDFQHRILIGGRKTGGHGVGKINELAAEIARQDSDRIFQAIRSNDRAFECDAFLLIAGAAGGTGSGAIASTTQLLKERYRDKPVYCLLVLPMEYEEVTEERTSYNTALCLKSVNMVADSVILVSNQRFVTIGASLLANFNEINRLIVEPYYDILCAGEETKANRIGTKTLDAGDVIQTLNGWTVLGYGRSELPIFLSPFKRKHFRERGLQTQRGLQALDKSMSDLSLQCDPADARRALYLVSGPANELNTEAVREVGEYLRNLIPKAVIRNGDYPREGDYISVHVMLSSLSNVDVIRNYYSRSTSLLEEFKRRREENETALRDMESIGKDLPTLL